MRLSVIYQRDVISNNSNIQIRSAFRILRQVLTALSITMSIIIPVSGSGGSWLGVMFVDGLEFAVYLPTGM